MTYKSYFNQLAAREQIEPLKEAIEITIDLSYASSVLFQQYPIDKPFEELIVYQVLDELADLSEQHESAEGLAKLIWYPAKVICAVMDHKILHKEEGQYIKEATELALGIYNGEATREEILALKDKFMSDEKNKVGFSRLDIYGKKIADQRSCKAMDPKYSEKAVKSLTETVNREDILFIALGNGGIAPGLDVFLRYCNQNETDSTFYPVRFSSHKRADQTPQLNDWEAKYLQEVRGDKKVVIFDEDTSSGLTLKRSHEFFCPSFVSDKDIILMTNEEGTLEIDDLWYNQIRKKSA